MEFMVLVSTSTVDGRRSTVEGRLATCTCDRQTNRLAVTQPSRARHATSHVHLRQTENGINFIQFVWPSLNPPAHDTPIADFFPPSAVNNLLPPGGLAHACTRSITQGSEQRVRYAADFHIIFYHY